MKEEMNITNQELHELETSMLRFSDFKKNLLPNPNALHRALASIPTERRAVRMRFAIAPAFILAAFVLFTPSLRSDSPVVAALKHEESVVDAAIATSVATNPELDEADTALDELVSLL